MAKKTLLALVIILIGAVAVSEVTYAWMLNAAAAAGCVKNDAQESEGAENKEEAKRQGAGTLKTRSGKAMKTSSGGDVRTRTAEEQVARGQI